MRNTTPGPAEFGLIVVNGKLVRQALENFSKDIPDIARKRMWATMQRIYNRMGIYAPEKPYKQYRRVGSRKGRPRSSGLSVGGHSHGYKRTYNLRDSRYITRQDDVYLFVNDPVTPRGHHYAVYVRGNAGGGQQARIHKAWGWELMGKIVSQELAKLPAEVVDALAVAFAEEAQRANEGVD